MIVYNNRRQPVQLGAELGRGGEAAVYRLAVQPALLAKIYHGRPRDDYDAKLAWMQAHPPADPTSAQGHASIAWPNDVLYDSAGRLVGYVMVNVQNAVPLLQVFNPRSRARTLPNFNRRYLHRTARNLAAALGALHDSSYIVGDLNESNIMVTPSALVTLIDADSFQVQRRIGAKPILHPCPVGKPEYTPPELQGKTFSEVPRQPEHDRFGLAVLIFQLLMDGNHPFRAQWLGGGEPPAVEDRIRDGAWPYAAAAAHGVPVAPPRGGPGLDRLHPGLADLVRQCFIDGHADPRARPTPQEWEAAIITAEKALTACTRGHLYSRHLSQCPICLAEADALLAAQRASQAAPKSTAPVSAAPARGPAGSVLTLSGLGRLTLRGLPWTTLLASLRPAAAVAPGLLACASCGQVNLPDEIYCQKCSRRLARQQPCGHCGREIPANARFCPRCGRPI